MKQLLFPREVVAADGVVSLANGGTGASTAPRAAQNLGMVTKIRVGLPLGPIPIDPTTGKISARYFSGVSRYRAEVDGNEEVLPSKPQTFNITNFDSRIEYTLTPTNGTVTRAEDIITYTAPSNRRLPVGFTLNGEKWPLKFVTNTPWNPNFVKGNILDRKLFTLRQASTGSMSMAYNGDFTRLYIGDPMAVSDNAKGAGQLETYTVTATGFNRSSGNFFRSPAFKVDLTLGTASGRYYGNSDAPGWAANSEETNVPENSTFFEAVLQGGIKSTVTMVAGGGDSGNGDGTDNPTSSTASNFMYDHMFVNAAQKLGSYNLFSGATAGASWPAGIDCGPQTFIINADLSYYFPIPGRLPFGQPSFPAFRLQYKDAKLIKVDVIDATITMVWGDTSATWSDPTPGFTAGTGVITGVWGNERTDTFQMTAPGIDSFAKIGDIYMRAEGQGLTTAAVVPVSRQFFTRENVNYGANIVQPRNNVNLQYLAATGRQEYVGNYEALEIRVNAIRTLVYSSLPTQKTGFGCFLATDDEGSAVVVGENLRDQVHVISQLGIYQRTLIAPVAGKGFGSKGDVSFNGKLIAVAAPQEGNGVVYVYTDGVQTARIASNLGTSYELGKCVKFSRDAQRLFISGIHKTSGIGRVVIYRLKVGTWTLENTLDGYNAVGFGTDISLSDDSYVALIGAPGNATVDGQAQVWTEGALGWDMQVALPPGETIKGGLYGDRVLLAPDARHAFVSAPALATSSTSFGRMYYFA